MRVLVVDDSASFREALLRLLAQHSAFQIVGTATNGWEAVQLARTARPDLVLMDLNMPCYNGLKATRHIKEEMPEVRVLLITASTAEAVREIARRLGAEDCLSKDLHQIMEALRRLVKGTNHGTAP